MWAKSLKPDSILLRRHSRGTGRKPQVSSRMREGTPYSTQAQARELAVQSSHVLKSHIRTLPYCVRGRVIKRSA